MTNRSNFIYFIKTIAVLMILNSHMGNLYPTSILSVGGSLGNTLFFLVSGYLLSTKVNDSFCEWMKSRMYRIYPPLWVCTGILFLVGNFKFTNFTDFAYRMLFPYYTYWFIAAIIIVYALVWFVNRRGKLLYWMITAIAIYIVWYVAFLDISVWSIEGPYFFKYVFYFIVMLLGIILRRNISINKLTTKYGWCVLTALSMVAYIVTRGMVAFVDSTIPYQFVVHIATILFGICFFEAANCFEEEISCSKRVVNITKLIGNSTLEIYLLNYGIIEFAGGFGFPINILIAFIAAITLGIICNKLIGVITSKVIPVHFLRELKL